MVALLGAACFDPRTPPPGAVVGGDDDGGGGDGVPGLFYGEFAARKQLTIPKDRVLANLPNFPVLVDLQADAELARIAEPGGSDLAFYDADGARATGAGPGSRGRRAGRR